MKTCKHCGQKINDYLDEKWELLYGGKWVEVTLRELQTQYGPFIELESDDTYTYRYYQARLEHRLVRKAK